MIDDKLIQQNILHAQHSVANATPISNNILLIKNVFTTELIHKLYSYILNHVDQPWESETDEYGNLQTLPRQKVRWHAESVIEETHEIFQALGETVLQKVKLNSNFRGMTLWKDLPGYTLQWHQDNPVIDVSMQVYLAGNSKQPGTQFRNFTVPFVPNTGYILYQTLGRTEHCLSGTVSDTRYSLFSMWSRDQ